SLRFFKERFVPAGPLVKIRSRDCQWSWSLALMRTCSPYKMDVLAKISLVSRLDQNTDTSNLRALNFNDYVVTTVGNIEKPITTVVCNGLAPDQCPALGI